ncbi:MULTISPECIES: hypothetical protein [Halomonadaceae]|uniref:Uncharacterized protein n=1 Tax=Vreelandella titanicae TaxID=664683 RepID=A0A558J099_9GAMM|nr:MULTISPECIES: hypothetical protein [Halomonas]EHA15122.1 hypothetical protein HAL1_12793 [Halomonas sp. HAL1]TVU87044.1 hypothetical protein FQP89_23555 [Halomonas titanicae]WKV95204.1 hypothetical protein Q3Y66_20085 [Halomonas sp. HAL1]
MISNEARAELRQRTLFNHLEPEAQQQAVDQLLNGESWDKVAQRVNDWVAEADWETRCETKEAASQERDYE